MDNGFIKILLLKILFNYYKISNKARQRKALKLIEIMLKVLKVEQHYIMEDINFQLTVETLLKPNYNGSRLRRKEFNNKKRKLNKQKEFKNKKERNKQKRFDNLTNRLYLI
jgi:hypothetical protein